MADSIELEIRARNITQEAFNQVSEALKAVGVTSLSVTDSASEGFSHWFSVITGGVAAGELLAGGLEKVLDVGRELPAMIGDFVERGSKVADVEHAFDGFAQSAGGAEAVLQALRDGTKGTVDDFELMRVANKSLSDGMKLSSDDFGTMAAGARILAKATGGDTASAFETLNEAMATGRTRTLNLIGVHVDADTAMQHYAASVGKAVADLTTQDKVAANAAAVMEQLRARVKDAGDEEMSLGEHLEAARVRFANFEDDLKAAIVNSPVLKAAFNDLSKAIDGAFGIKEQDVVTAFRHGVEDVAIGAVGAGKLIVSAAQLIGTEWYQAEELITGGLKSLLEEQLKSVAVLDSIAAAGSKIGGPEAAAFGLLHDGLQKIIGPATQLDKTLTDTFTSAPQKLKDFVASGDTLIGKLDAEQMKLISLALTADSAGKAVGKAMSGGVDGGAANSKDIQKFLDDAGKLADAFHHLEQSVGESSAIQLMGPKFDTAREKAMELGVSLDRIGHGFADIDLAVRNSEFAKLVADMTAKTKDGVASILEELKKLPDQQDLWDAKMVSGWIDADRRMTEASMYGTELRIAQIDDAQKKEIESLGARTVANADFYDKRKAAIDAYYQHERDVANATADTLEERMRGLGFNIQADLDLDAAQATQDFNDMTASGLYTADELQAAWKRMVDANIAAGHGLKQQFEADLTGMATSMLNAFSSGGSVGQAAQSSAVKLGSDISKNLFGGMVTDLSKESPLLGQALGELAGPLGGAVVSLGIDLGEKLWNSLFGTAGRDAVVNFASSQGGFDALHQQLSQLGAEGEQLWIQLTQGTGRNNAQQAAANIKAVTDALNTLHQAENSQISDLASKIQGLGGSINPALDPYIKKLQQAGILTQQNADALKKLEGDGTPTYDELTSLQQKYNLTAAEMGSAFQTKQIDAQFQTLIDDTDELTRGGIDLKGAMFDASGALSGLGTAMQTDIEQAIKAGVQIPANLKAAAQALINQGDLLDANGKKITDINQLTFGETMQDSLDTLNKTLLQLISTMTGGGPNSLTGALETIGNTTVSPHIKPIIDAPDVPGGFSGENFPHTSDDIPGHADGAYITKDHLSIVHAGEWIGNNDFMAQAIARAISIVGSGGRGNDFAVAPVMMDTVKVADIIVRRIPESVRRFTGPTR